jgi:hypothetical protein
MTVGMVWRAEMFIAACVVMMGSVEVTTMHPRGSGDPELPPMPKVAPSSSEDSSRAVHREGNPLWSIPMNMVPESQSWGET